MRLARAVLFALTLGGSALGARTALAEEAPSRPERRVADDSNVNPPPDERHGERDRPEVGGKHAGAEEGPLHLPFRLDPSPEWTQDRGFPGTRFWRLDLGSVEIEQWYQAKVHRPAAAGLHGNGTEHMLQTEIEVGVLPGIQLDVYENLIKAPGEDFVHAGNQIEFRVAPWNYGQVPLNPTLYLEWHPTHGEVDGNDRWEIRLLVGGSPFERFFLAANTITECETGGDRKIEWGFTAAAAYELIPGALRMGAETRITWEFLHHEKPTDGFDAEVGPNTLFRPLALLKPEWGHWLKVSFTGFFGLNGDRASEFFRGIVVVGCEL